MLAQIPHVLLAAHAGTIMGVETNAMQFYPEASSAEARVHPGLYRRRNGCVDLSTLEGARIASERLEAMARRLCGELARRQGLAYQPSWAACVQDTLAGALAQANVLAAARNSRTARRSVP